MSPFTPAGPRALRVIVAELAGQRGYGETITFTELAQALDVATDEAGKAKIRQAVASARPLLLSDYQRALTAKRGVGYRVALPGEFSGIAQDHRSRADRQLQKGLAVIDHAPVDRMSPDERKRHQAVAMVLHNLHSRMTSAEQRLADLEAAVYGGQRRRVIPGQVEDEE